MPKVILEEVKSEQSEGEDLKNMNKRQKEEFKKSWFDYKFMKKADIDRREQTKMQNSLMVNMKRVFSVLEEDVQRYGGINVTMVAEKPTVAFEIAKILSNNTCKVEHWNRFKAFTWKGDWENKPNRKRDEILKLPAHFTMISLFGNILK